MSSKNSSSSTSGSGSGSSGNGSYEVTGSGTNSQVGRAYPMNSLGGGANTCLKGNSWDSRDYGSSASNQNSYHYSNSDGSYYYSNPSGM